MEEQPAADVKLLSEEEGIILLSSARSAISNFLKDPSSRRNLPPKLLAERFQRKQGCFVTLRRRIDGSLRGCIGFAEPVFKLSEAITEAAIYSATNDPRFPPLDLEELEREISIEVSVLTPPVEIKVSKSSIRRELPKLVEVGKDGLILRWTFGSGLLLPQVATEFGWDAQTFLENLAMKAGAPPDEWLSPGSRIFKFQAQIFSEGEGPALNQK